MPKSKIGRVYNELAFFWLVGQCLVSFEPMLILPGNQTAFVVVQVHFKWKA